MYLEIAVTDSVLYKPGSFGTGSEIIDAKFAGTDITLRGAIYTREGYLQTGWSTTENGPKEYNLNEKYTSDKDLVLYPVWSELIYITYLPDEYSPDVSYQDIKPFDSPINLRGKTFSREGYAQNGWTSVSGTEAEYGLGEEYSEENTISLYPSWTDEAVFTYLPGLWGHGEKTTEELKLYSDGKIADRLFTRSGYFQSGWSLSDGGDKLYNLNETIYIEEDMTLYPVWEKGYVVEYRSGSKPSQGTIELKGEYTNEDVYFVTDYASGITVPDSTYEFIPDYGNNKSYTQVGWSYSDGGKLEIRFGDVLEITGNVVLYPVWVCDAMWAEIESDTYMDVPYSSERIAVFEYNGTKIKPDVKVYSGQTLLTLNKDYTLKYLNNTNANMNAFDAASKGYRVSDVSAGIPAEDIKKIPAVEITGKGTYSGKDTIYFAIAPIDIGTKECSDSGNLVYEYTEKKNAIVINKPVPAVNATVSGKVKKLSVNKEYKVTYLNADCTETLTGFSLVGEYKVKMTGTGNFTGERYIDVTVTNKFAIDKVTVKNVKAANYTGSEIKQPTMTVTYGKTKLVEGTDYTVSYSNNIEVGTATVTINGIGDYVGSKSVTYKINGVALSKVKMEGFAKAFNYTGEEITQRYVRFFVENKDETMFFLYEGKDYEAKYTNNLLPGVATVEFIGKGGYTGSVKKTFKINGIALSKAVVNNFKSFSFDYSASENYLPMGTMGSGDIYVTYKADKDAPAVELKCLTEEEFSNHEDGFFVKYITDPSQKGNNINAGTAKVEFIGSGVYTGSVKKSFKILPYDMGKDAKISMSVEANESYEYQKGGVKPKVTVGLKRPDGSEYVLSDTADYKIAYKNNTAVNDLSNPKKLPTMTISGKGNFKGKLAPVIFAITVKDVNDVNSLAADKIFSAKADNYTTTVTLTDKDGKKLSAGTDYDKVIVYRYAQDVSVMNGTNEEHRLEGETVVKGDIVPAGTGMNAYVTGMKNYKGTVEIPYKVVTADIKTVKVEFINSFYYNEGKEIKPTKDDFVVWVKSGKNWVEVEASQYEIVTDSYKNNTTKGTGTFTIRGLDNYGGTLNVKFTIRGKGLIWWFNNLIK